jgi:alkylation response protein AidB-like acyl-CoA dehydrogenase
MALGLTEDHQALAGAVRGWAQRHCPPSIVRGAAEAADSGCGHYRTSLGPGLAGLGVVGLHVPEEHGGHGFGLPELAVALAELGRALVPGAFLPTALASAVLTASGAPGKLLTGLADGSRTGAVGLAHGLTAREDERGGLIVEGSAWPVLGGSAADLLILPLQTSQGELWAAADPAIFDVSELDSLDLTRPVARVSAAGVSLPPGQILTGVDRAAVTGLAATLFGAEACGITEWCVHTAAEYAKVRMQFGRPIGQFQGVKHRCARMLTAAEQAAAAVWDAARAHDDAGITAPERELAATVAAVIALDAAVSCAHDAIQVLGGIGYTWDHDAHLYYRRALSLRALLGPAGAWAERAAKLALGGTRRTLEVDLAAETVETRGRVRADMRAIAALDRGEHARELAAGGWVMPHLPRPWGRAAGPAEQVIVAQEMKAAGLQPPQLAIGAWVVPALVQYGTPDQQERFLPPTLCGELVWCQLFSEPEAGSDLAGLTTRAEPADGGWRITGQKIWTSLARQAQWAICIARTDPGAPRHDGITYFLVDMSAPGLDVRPLREMTGDAIFNQVFLDGVFVPAECVVGEVNAGWRVARTTLANERVALSSSWGYGSGVAELLRLASARGGAGDAPPGDVTTAAAGGGAGGDGAEAGWPATDLRQLGQLVCEGHALDLLGLRVTLKQLSGTEPGATSSVRKLLGMQHAQRIADFCLAALGPQGALGARGAAAVWRPDGTPDISGPAAGAYWSRQVLFTRALTIGGGTTDIQLNIIGERLLGLPRDPEPGT